jgi:hypothetical protein
MIAAGSVEALATTFLNEAIRHSRHKFVRRCAPPVPLRLTATYLVEGSRNLSAEKRILLHHKGVHRRRPLCVAFIGVLWNRRHIATCSLAKSSKNLPPVFQVTACGFAESKF